MIPLRVSEYQSGATRLSNLEISGEACKLCTSGLKKKLALDLMVQG